MDETEGRRFTRVEEDFECLVCGHFVRGNGYTNHCPRCLSSRHVDRNPGDRAADCGAVMEARSARFESRRGWMILHRCRLCGHEKWNKCSPDDDIDELARLSRDSAPPRED